jgi:hypothetical protein
MVLCGTQRRFWKQRVGHICTAQVGNLSVNILRRILASSRQGPKMAPIVRPGQHGLLTGAAADWRHVGDWSQGQRGLDGWRARGAQDH